MDADRRRVLPRPVRDDGRRPGAHPHLRAIRHPRQGWHGDALAEFVVDTWTIFGLEVLAVGVVLLAATRRAALARGAISTVLAIEVSRGIVADLVMIARGTNRLGYLIWIAIHSAVIVAGLLCIRAARSTDAAASDLQPAVSPPHHVAV